MWTRLSMIACLCLAAPHARADAGLDPAVAACDQMAAEPEDPDRPAGVKGVELVAIDQQTAVLVCRKAAETVKAGPDARRIQYQLGRALYASDSYPEAKTWFDKAAASGSTAAMIQLSTMYRNGFGVAPSEVAFQVWLDKAIDGGSIRALDERGAAYDLARDYASARVWYEKAAAKGNTSAMWSLGTLYEEGKGVPQDYAVSRSWYEKSAAGGNAFAMFTLGSVYNYGTGVRKDYVAARKWYEKAAAAGYADAKERLADLPH